MGKKIPKMLIPVSGKPLIYWALRNLEECPSVHTIVLVVPPLHKKVFEKRVRQWRFRKVRAVVSGGKERTDSTRNALKAMPIECRWIGIHDGARAFVACELVRKCFEAAKKSGAAILAVPVKDTIKVARSRLKRGPIWIEETVPRRICWAAQTPQVFRRDIAEKIHGNRPPLQYRRGFVFTDDASLAEAWGTKVAIVPGSYDNLKITTPEDLILAETFLKRKKNETTKESKGK